MLKVARNVNKLHHVTGGSFEEMDLGGWRDVILAGKRMHHFGTAIYGGLDEESRGKTEVIAQQWRGVGR